MDKKVMAIVAIIVIILVGAGGYAVVNRNASSNKTGSTQTPTTSGGTNQSTSSALLIQTKSDSKVGAYLADSNGKALYTYGGDTAGVSNCSGACLYSWPIYEATSTTNLPTHLTIINRTDGSKQYAYNGMPLYTFTSDSAGKVTGDNVNDFHVAKP